MPQMELFRSSEHLERCYDDPDPYAVEAIFYTTWQILEKFSGHVALANEVVIQEVDEERTSDLQG